MARRKAVPTYRLHKPTGQAFVRVYGDDGKPRYIYLGPYGSPESRSRYAKIVDAAKAVESPALMPSTTKAGDVWVGELCIAFIAWADQHYRRPDGQPTGAANDFRHAFRFLFDLHYTETPVRDFGPLALQRVRERIVATGVSRIRVNQLIGRIKRAFRWGVSQELVPVEVAGALSTVEGLRRGRTTAADYSPVTSAPLADVRKTLRYLTPTVRAMVELQLATGMRPGEVQAMTLAQIDQTGPVWIYRPENHKNAWRGKSRAIFLGPKAQKIIKAIAKGIGDGEPIFSLARARAEKTGRGRPSDKRGEVWFYGQVYYALVRYAATKAGVPHWHPNQLRHTFATMVRAKHGLEAAQILLGHERADVTQIYAERDGEKAAKVIKELG